MPTGRRYHVRAGGSGPPSGEAMPNGDIAGWTLVFNDDFTTDVAVGGFPGGSTSVYPGNKWNHYPSNGTFRDTSKRGTYNAAECVWIDDHCMKIRLFSEVGADRSVTGVTSTDVLTLAGHGFQRYDNLVFSSMTGGSSIVAGTEYYATAITTDTFKITLSKSGAGSDTGMDIGSDLTAGQVKMVRHNVAAPAPRAQGVLTASTASNAQLYGRYAARARKVSDIPLYKTAWLLWPQDGVWPQHGEIDWPEGGLGSGNTVSAFMHRADATDGGDQDVRNTAATHADWHTYVIEWGLNRCAFYLDGTLLGSEITSRVPSWAMYWLLQSETNLDSNNPPAAATDGTIEVDWVAVWEPA